MSALLLGGGLLGTKSHQVYGDCRDMSFGYLDRASNSRSSVYKVYGRGHVIYYLSKSQIPTYLYRLIAAIPSLFFLSIYSALGMSPRTFAYTIPLPSALTELYN